MGAVCECFASKDTSTSAMPEKKDAKNIKNST